MSKESPDVMKKTLAIVLCIAHIVVSKEAEPPVKGAGPAVRVTAPAGTFVGRQLVTSGGSSYNAFRGIPYAEPPTGKLRFRKTLPVEKLAEEYDASEERPFCVQMNMILNDFGEGSEDCLYLNVFSPIMADGQPRKVFVFIHGGGNMNGMKDFYQPASLVAENDIIVVTINYRLGLLGFLSSQSAASPGNYGLWDQVEALRWVKANIRAFGGDPTAVTVGGESAGGFDTTALTVSPHARGLFSRAFPMSGSLGLDNPMMGTPLPVTEKLARRENCLSEEAPVPQHDDEWKSIVECLRQVPVNRFSSAADLGEMPTIGPVVDGDFFPKKLKEIFADEEYLESIDFHDRDYLVSLCYNEGDLFNAWQEMGKAAMTPEQLEAISPTAMWHGTIGQLLTSTNAFGPMSPEAIAHIAAWYEENYEINPMADFAADAIFHVPVTEYINAAVAGWDHTESRLQLLRFVNFPEFLTGPYKGTLHVIDLAYLFDIDVEQLNRVIDFKIDGSKWSEEDDQLKKKYSDLVASFVKTGTASTAGVKWPAYTESDASYLEFGPTPRLMQHLKADRADLFHHVIPAWMEEFPHTQAQGHAQDEL